MMNWRIIRVALTGSTNDDVRNAAEAGEGEGLVIVAKQQSSGRGRQGRVWQSPEGNLYASILLKPTIPASEWPTYSFVVALAVHEAIKSVLPQSDVKLKWPNDVLVNDQKISGVLIETSGDALITGIGINVRHYPTDALYPCTSIATEGNAQAEVDQVLNNLLSALSHWHDVRQTKGFEPVRTAWLTHARQGTLQVRLPQAETPLHGRMNGLDQHGNLLLRLEDGQERLISTGDVLGFT